MGCICRDTHISLNCLLREFLYRAKNIQHRRVWQGVQDYFGLNRSFTFLIGLILSIFFHAKDSNALLTV